MKTIERYNFRSLHTLAVLILLTGFLFSACTSAGDQGKEPVDAFTNVNLIPMTSETVIEGQTVLVK
jgi:hypothetical protein